MSFTNTMQIQFQISSLFSYNIKLVPFDLSTRGEGRSFKALPKLETFRLFAFVQRDMFLKEPISTCFSFLLNWNLPQTPSALPVD
jgi:hypothetical protein